MPLKAVLFRRASGDVVVLAVVVSVMDTVTEDVVVAEVSVLRRGRNDATTTRRRIDDASLGALGGAWSAWSLSWSPCSS